VNDKLSERSAKQCTRCAGKKKEADGSICKLCDGKGELQTILIGDNEVVVKDKARFVG